MLEISVNRLVNDVDPSTLSASVAERGKNAGPETWSNSVACATESPLLTTDEQRKDAREFFRGFGAWDDEEIAGWSHAELDALVLQYAAGDLREAQAVCPGRGVAGINWRQYAKESEAGTIGGRLFRHKGELWISLD